MELFTVTVAVGDLESMKWHINLNHQLENKILYIQCENRQKYLENPVYIKVQLSLDHENYFGETNYIHRISVNRFQDYSQVNVHHWI